MRRYIILFLIGGVLAAVAGCGDDATKTADAGTGTVGTGQSAQPASPQVALAFDQPPAAADPIGDPRGPFYHSVLKASSADGLSFTVAPGTLLEHASVPDLIRMPDGRLIIYAVDGANRSKSGLMVAMSDDDGATFKQGSVQSGGAPLGADPDAIVLPDGSIRLYYVVFPRDKPPLDENGQPIMSGQIIKVKSALSRDGVTFKEEPGVRYEAAASITDPDVVQIGGQWFMYLSDGPRNLAVSSPDGLTFTPQKTIRENGSVSNTVPIGARQYRQFYCSEGIKSAVSSDGLSWQDEPGTRIPLMPDTIQCDPAPVQIGDMWFMVFKTAAAMPLQ